MAQPYPRALAASSKLLALVMVSSGLDLGLSLNKPQPHGPDADGICTSATEPIVPVRPADDRPAADFVVVNSGLAAWRFNGSLTNNPTLTLNRGQTYSFDLTAVPNAHPFEINSVSNTAGGTIYAGPAFTTVITFTPDNSMPATIYYHCQVHFTTMAGTINLVTPPLLLSVKAFLEGAYDTGSGLMRDDLRAAGIVPLTEPYTALGYTQVNGNGGASTSLPVLATTGNDAIVDWVVVELRDNTTPSTILQTRCALIQRDGDVVATDGTSPVQFSLAAGTYQVALRHRTHLGAMTLTGVALSGTNTTVDLSSPATATWGTNATKTVGTVHALWMGDATFDGSLLYTGSGNDRDPILIGVGGTTPNNSVNGYLSTDLNMDGSVRYTGVSNDRDPVLVNVGSTTPNNTRVQQLP